MAGFVVFEEGRAWGVSNATWRATVPPAAALLREAPARTLVEDAVRGAIHYLDLTGAPPEVRADLAKALRGVRAGYGSGELTWGDAEQTAAFLHLFDGLLAMFDDPDMGRPMWPTPA